MDSSSPMIFNVGVGKGGNWVVGMFSFSAGLRRWLVIVIRLSSSGPDMVLCESIHSSVEDAV
jgi:hypothetical protein